MLKIKQLLALLITVSAFAGCGQAWGMEEKIEKIEKIEGKPVIIFGHSSVNNRIFVNTAGKENIKSEFQPLSSDKCDIFKKANREELKNLINQENGKLIESNGVIYIKRGSDKIHNSSIQEYSCVMENSVYFDIENNTLAPFFVKVSEELQNCVNKIPQELLKDVVMEKMAKNLQKELQNNEIVTLKNNLFELCNKETNKKATEAHETNKEVIEAYANLVQKVDDCWDNTVYLATNYQVGQGSKVIELLKDQLDPTILEILKKHIAPGETRTIKNTENNDQPKEKIEKIEKNETVTTSSWLTPSSLCKTILASLIGFVAGTVECHLEESYPHIFKNDATKLKSTYSSCIKWGARQAAATAGMKAPSFFNEQSFVAETAGLASSIIGMKYGPKIVGKVMQTCGGYFAKKV